MDSTSAKPEEVKQRGQAGEAPVHAVRPPRRPHTRRRPQSMLSALLAVVDTLINLELGCAMRMDLKLAIRKKINEIGQEQMGHRHISWKHIWDNNFLTHHSEKLIDDNSALSSDGILNNSKVCLTPHIMSRVHQKHSRRRKHRFFHGLSRKLLFHLMISEPEKPLKPVPIQGMSIRKFLTGSSMITWETKSSPSFSYAKKMEAYFMQAMLVDDGQKLQR